MPFSWALRDAFGDYVKVGLPLLLLTMLVTVMLVAVIYPL